MNSAVRFKLNSQIVANLEIPTDSMPNTFPYQFGIHNDGPVISDSHQQPGAMACQSWASSWHILF